MSTEEGVIETSVVNALTIDVEDYFQVHAFSEVIRPTDWDCFESRVERNTHRILDVLDSHNGPPTTDGRRGERQLATFFILGWIAERYPQLIKEIHARGHEVACHGYAHKCISAQTPKEFKEDVKRAKEILEDLTHVEVIGYRAPTYSVTKETLWSLEILAELGFRYDSSIFPIKHDFYGFCEAPRFPFYIDFSDGDLVSQLRNPKYLHEDSTDPTDTTNQRLNRSNTLKTNSNSNLQSPCSRRGSCFVEFPLSTMTLFGRNLPCAGGGYFRLFPYWYTKHGFKRINHKRLEPAIFYLHPWEIDPELPLVSHASPLAKFRTYVNLKATETKLTRLLSEFKFAPLASILMNCGS